LPVEIDTVPVDWPIVKVALLLSYVPVTFVAKVFVPPRLAEVKAFDVVGVIDTVPPGV
jgi:hypothetical protein